MSVKAIEFKPVKSPGIKSAYEPSGPHIKPQLISPVSVA